jgi:hypothetical protein
MASAGRVLLQLSHCFLSRLLLMIVGYTLCYFDVTSAWSQTVRVAWNGNGESDLAGYKVYYGRGSRLYEASIDVGTATEYTFDELPEYFPIYLAVTAYDTVGNEGDYSMEVLYDESGASFSLMANYPNPFNPETHIPFRLMRTCSIHLAVYDILGRRVRLLESGEKRPGTYESVWHGRDDHGKQVANGVYFCRLIVGDYSMTMKLILMR